MRKIYDWIVKAPKKVYLGILLVLFLIDAIAFGLSPLLQKIEMWSIAAAYNSISAVIPSIEQFAQSYRYVFLALTVLTAILFFYKPHLLLIKHVSFSLNISKVDPNFLKHYSVKKIEINQTTIMTDSMPSVAAVKLQDEKITDALYKSAPLSYYGIAHTPLIFRAGFMIGDQDGVKLLHRRRLNNTVFEEWSHEKSRCIITPQEENKQKKSAELIVAISTSLKITRQNIEALGSKGKHILFFESNDIDFDCIRSYDAAETARNTIMHAIRECVKKYNIQKIDLVISSSVAFTFFLAQAFSAQHEPTTIVYHYQNGTYPWGICINEKAESSIVINT